MKKNLYSTIIGQLTKNGKKNIAANIMNQSFFNTAIKTNLSLIKIFKGLSKKLGSIIETKIVRLRKNVYVIPFPLKNSRRFYLIAKNVISSVEDNKSKISLNEKLTEELFSLIKNKQSKSLQKKETIIKTAITNKANVHYRW
jgi:small subunit ribosomal protein S7